MKVGLLHAYPNGSLQFENYMGSPDDQEENNDSRFNPRSANEKDFTDQNLESIARAMSTGVSSVNMKSCYQSIKTPFTRGSCRSQLSRKTGMSGYNTITNNWYANNNHNLSKSHHSIKQKHNRVDVYSNFSKQTKKTYMSI